MLRYFRVLPSLRTFCQQGAPEAPRAPMLHLMNAAVAQVDLSSGLSSGSSASSFDRLVLHGDKTLLVMFGAPWCSHCKTLAVSCSPLLPATLLARLTAFVSSIMMCARALSSLLPRTACLGGAGGAVRGLEDAARWICGLLS